MDVYEERYVSELWDKRIELADRRKRRRMVVLFDTLLEVMLNLHAGKKYEVKDMLESGYYKRYLKRLHPVDSNRIRRHLIYNFRDSIGLYYSIKKEGLKNPLDYYDDGGGKMHLGKGYRRLTALKALGVNKCMIVIHGKMEGNN